MSDRLYRVIGPPGTGKTTYLARQCLNATQKYGGESIAIASLTRTAAAEIASRSTGVPRQNIGTLHSHAFRQLKLSREEVAETTKGVSDWNEKCGVESWKLSKRSVANPENSGPDDSSFGDNGDALLAEVGVLRAKCIDERLWPQRVYGFWRKWCEWKSESGRLDFTDMIVRALDDVDSLGVKIMMVDEAQDMSLLEMRLARKWGESAEQLLIVGDPDQTIYEWRGSDPSAFYDGEAALTQVLSQSYRVPKRVHDLAVGWIERCADREKVDYLPTEQEGRVERHQLLCYREGASLGKLCESLIEDGSSVAVLASCAYMLSPVISELRKMAIPFCNPYRTERYEWNPLKSDRLLSFLARKHDPRFEGKWSWKQVLKWAEHIQSSGYMERGAKTEIRTRAGVSGRWYESEELNLATLQDVLSYFHSEHDAGIDNGDVDWWRGSLLHKQQLSERYRCEVYKQRGYESLSQRPQLSVGTIHSYKGGEADKVVLIPDLSRAGAMSYYGRGRDAVIRLFYVGMTRARCELHILGNAAPDFAHF